MYIAEMLQNKERNAIIFGIMIKLKRHILKNLKQKNITKPTIVLESQSFYLLRQFRVGMGTKNNLYGRPKCNNRIIHSHI